LLIKAKQSARMKDTVLTVKEQEEIRKALLWTVDYANSQSYNYKIAGLDWQIRAEKIIEDCKNNNE
jgi:PhoPQ-activated pathogenicity-related protein